MEKIVVTAGQDFTDIDILACAISYNELLQNEGKNSVVVLVGEFNKSITEEIIRWPFSYQTEPITRNCSYVIVDISQPEHLAKFVDQSKIIELYDHHFGFEEIWKKRINGKVTIEKVGSCATLIWEEYKKRGFEKDISETSAKLISAAIISNTLNFRASVTNSRDTKAFHELEAVANFNDEWIAKYFQDQETALFKNTVKEVRNDTHKELFPNSADPLIIGQIELWNSREFIKSYRLQIEEALKEYGTNDWFLTSPSISEGKNYFYTKSDRVKKLLTDMMKVNFKEDVGETEKLYLRKEIKKIIYNY